jgi:hypothetical protein
VIASLPDAARRSFGREGDEDLAVEDLGAPRPALLNPKIIVVESEAPEAP